MDENNVKNSFSAYGSLLPSVERTPLQYTTPSGHTSVTHRAVKSGAQPNLFCCIPQTIEKR